MIEALIIGIVIANVIVSLIQLLNHWERAQLVYFSYEPGIERIKHVVISLLVCAVFGMMIEFVSIWNDWKY